MKGITFSTDTRILTIEDNIATGKLAEQYFKMEDDPNQIPATMENVRWINKNIPDCVNAIKLDGKLIGFTFIIPCNKLIMDGFLKGEISEKTLFEKVKKSITYDNFDTIYLCSTFVKPEFRRKGLALKAGIKSIRKIMGKRRIKPILFYWGYSKEGKKGVLKLAKVLGLKIKGKK